MLAEGGTPLTVHGAGFSQLSSQLGLLACRVRNILLLSRFVSPNTIVCNSVRSRTGFAQLEVCMLSYPSGALLPHIPKLRGFCA